MQFIYSTVVEDWVVRGHTIPANMIADYAQELKIPQKYVKAFITHAGDHYEFAKLSTPGDGMNCGLYSLLMLAFAYYNPKSREILDKLMNNEISKLSPEDIAIFNKAIKGSKEEFDQHDRTIRSGGQTVQQVLQLVYNKFSKFDDKGQAAGRGRVEEHPENHPEPLKDNENKDPEIIRDDQELKEIKKDPKVLEEIKELDEVEEALLSAKSQKIENMIVDLKRFVQDKILHYPKQTRHKRLWVSSTIYELKSRLNKVKDEVDERDYEEIKALIGNYIVAKMDADKRFSSTAGTELWSHFDGTAVKRENKKPVARPIPLQHVNEEVRDQILKEEPKIDTDSVLKTRLSQFNLNFNEMFGNEENDSDPNDEVVDPEIVNLEEPNIEALELEIENPQELNFKKIDDEVESAKLKEEIDAIGATSIEELERLKEEIDAIGSVETSEELEVMRLLDKDESDNYYLLAALYDKMFGSIKSAESIQELDVVKFARYCIKVLKRRNPGQEFKIDDHMKILKALSKLHINNKAIWARISKQILMRSMKFELSKQAQNVHDKLVRSYKSVTVDRGREWKEVLKKHKVAIKIVSDTYFTTLKNSLNKPQFYALFQSIEDDTSKAFFDYLQLDEQLLELDAG